MTGPLAGLRVLDLADQSGALAGKLLAQYGAEVVLIEPPGGGAWRSIPPFFEGLAGPNRSLFHWFYHVGKRGIVLDVGCPDGRARLDRLAAQVDVVIETAAPGWSADLRTRHPHLVVASITPFGQTGPYAAWRASDLVAQAMGGMLYVSGHADGAPQPALGLQAYHQAGVLAANGIMAALLARDVTGRGQHVDVSLQAAVAASLEHVAGFFHQDGRMFRRQGTLHWTRYFRVGRCRDGFVLHCTLGDWTSLVEWVKADGMAADLDDPAWDDVRHRQEHAERLFEVLDAWALRYTVDELHEGAQLRRIPYAAVRPPEALLVDPQLAARGFFVPIEHPDLGIAVPYPGLPFRVGDALPLPQRRPPDVGEHDADVFAQFGVTV